MFTASSIGHLHPLLVHLPIGILLFAAGLMLFGRIRNVDVWPAVSFAWGAGALSAILACVAGWLLAQSGEYDAGMVAKHQWAGIITAALGTLTYFVKKYRAVPAAVTVITLTIAGHYGGNLTHGEDYLFPARTMAETLTDTASTPANAVAAVTEDSAAGRSAKIVRRSFVYRDQVVPILKNKCYNCHSVSKKKGGLRLDTEGFIRKGGKNGPVLVAGNAQKSKLFTYLLLPEGDDRHMPPKGKLQLSRQEIGILQAWIQKGASFTGEIEVLEADEPAITEAAEAALPSPAVDLPAKEPAAAAVRDLESVLLEKPVGAPDAALLKKLRDQQVVLTRMNPKAEYLSVNFVNARQFQPEALHELTGLQDQLMRLRLTGQPVRDAELQYLTSFRNLTRLNLENTDITDQALSVLAAMPSLEQLNLYGTAVTDTGLAELTKYPKLKVVYVWQTKVTPEGIKKLKSARPDLKIETGTLQLAPPDTSRTL